jgi:hypothetical protein
VAKFNPVEAHFGTLAARDVRAVRLASAKRSIYNPALPTLRRIDRDDTLCKLTDTHARHNTILPPGKHITCHLLPSNREYAHRKAEFFWLKMRSRTSKPI